MSTLYTWGNCLNCNMYKPLKNGYCNDCQAENNNLNTPDFLKDLFNFGDNNEN